MASVNRVLIVGGGIAGMTLATALQRNGIGAEIVEIHPDWTVMGVGIAVQGATLRALKTIGVLDRCVASGFPYSKLVACDVNGNVTGTVTLPSLLGPGYPECVGIMRPILHEILHDALQASGASVRLGLSISSLEQNASAVKVQFTDGSQEIYDLVVGADGVHSKVREIAFGAHIQPEFMEQAVWRAMVERPPEIQGRYFFFGPRHKAGFNPVSQTEMYIFLIQNIPGNPRIPEEQLPAVMRELLSDFGGVMARVRDQVRDPQRLVYRPFGSLLVPRPWFRGRVLLVGDAAHTCTPHMASGAGIAIEDAIVLAELLQSDAPLSDLLDRFMTRRYERCRMVVESSYQMAIWEKKPNTPGADPVGVLNRANAALAAPI